MVQFRVFPEQDRMCGKGCGRGSMNKIWSLSSKSLRRKWLGQRLRVISCRAHLEIAKKLLQRMGDGVQSMGQSEPF